jgi:hypothetical protein
MKKILFLFLLASPALAQIEAQNMTVDVQIKAHMRGHKVWLYEVDGEKITVGTPEFALWAAGHAVDYERAVQFIERKPNGKNKIKLKKGSTVLDFDDLDKDTLKELLKQGYLIHRGGA